MTRLKVVFAAKMEKFVLQMGFKRIRQKGSHVFYRHPDGRVTTIPFHKGRALARPLIREILREIETNIEDYNKHW